LRNRLNGFRNEAIEMAIAKGNETIATRLKPCENESEIMPYSETFKDHLAHPRSAGELADADVIAEETNPVCGDRLRLSLRIRNRRIQAARFLAYGCPPTLACGSALAGTVQGMSIKAAMKLSKNQIVEAVGGLPSRKQHAASLAIETLQAALAKHAAEDLD